MGENDNERKGIGGIIIIFFLVGAVILFFILAAPTLTTGQSPVDVSRVVAAVKAGDVQRIVVDGDQLQATLTNGSELTSHKESGVSLGQMLKDYGVTDEQISKLDVRVDQSTSWSSLLGNLIWILPMVFLAVIFFYMMRQGQGTGGQAINFAKSRARQVNVDKPTVTFGDVAGVEEAKQELEEVVQFLKYPNKFRALGAHIPRGLLLVGPPGTGKTLLARAVAGEAGVPFFSISGSEFVELFVGVGASRVRDLFDQAKRNSPCIVFIDEIDAVGRQRGTGLGGGHDEREQTLNQILVEMDGFDTRMNIVVIAATNRPDVLDPALLRPGRFDRRVILDSPDIQGRLEILRVHVKGKPIDPRVDLESLAKQTPGFSGADLENLVNEAAILAARNGAKTIGLLELEEAIDRVIAGPARKSRIISPRQKAITAYHEAGHALTAHLLSNADPVHKISIVARGMSGGHTRLLPTEDNMLLTRSQLQDTLAYALGGQVAEEIIFGEMTTGAGSDLQQVTRLARSMVTEYGMSEKLGPMVFGHKAEMSFLGRDLGEQRDYGDETANEIDSEVRRLVNEARERAYQILTKNKAKLVQIADALMEKETLQGDDLKRILDLPRPAPRGGKVPPGTSNRALPAPEEEANEDYHDQLSAS